MPMKKATWGSILGALAGIAGLFAAAHGRKSVEPWPTPAILAEWDATCRAVLIEQAHRDITDAELTECMGKARGGAQAEDLRAWADTLPKPEPPPAPEPIPIALAPEVGIRGKYFTNHGESWTAIETSEFSLYKRYLDGEDITPILAERHELGFNTLRVWLLNTSVIPGGLQPKDYPQFYESLRPFVRLCASYGFVVEVTAFTQTQSLMPSRDAQVAHWTAVQDALRPVAGQVLLELVNEANQHDNRTDAALLALRPAGLLASSGSNGADSAPPEPAWDYVLYHSNGLSEFQRKVGHNAMEYADHYRKPAMANENTRYPDQDQSEAHAYDAAMGAALLSAGSCFHSQSGKFSRRFDADERRYAAAWVAGAKSVPLEFREGQYIRRDDLNGPQVIRAYEKRLPDGRSYVIRIRP